MATPVVRRNIERRLYTVAALVALLIVFAGFARTYYLKMAFGTPPLTGLQQLHGLVMSSWFVLFLVQVRLVAGGRTDLHRRVGVLGRGHRRRHARRGYDDRHYRGPTRSYAGAAAIGLPHRAIWRHDGVRAAGRRRPVVPPPQRHPQAADAALLRRHPDGGDRTDSRRTVPWRGNSRVFPDHHCDRRRLRCLRHDPESPPASGIRMGRAR